MPYVMESGGRLYFRRFGKLTRLPAEDDPGFLTAYEIAKGGRGRPQTDTTTVDDLIARYKSEDNPSWTKLKPRTRRDYDAVLAYLSEKVGSRDQSYLTRPVIISAREKLVAKGKVRFANYVGQVASVLVERAIDIGWRAHNPIKGLPPVEMPEDRQAAHVPWTDGAAAKWRKEAKGLYLLAFELGVGVMPRPDDLTRFRWDDYDGTYLRLRSSKTGKGGIVPVPPHLKAVLDAASRRGLTVLADEDTGAPLSYFKLARLMLAERKRLEVAEHDLHALRYRGIMELAWAGCNDEEIASYSLHVSKQMIAKYAGIARQQMFAKSAARKRQRAERNGRRT